MSDLIRYKQLQTKRSKGKPITKEEEDFVIDYGLRQIQEQLNDPLIMCVLKRMSQR